MIKKNFFISIGTMVFSALYMVIVMAFPFSTAKFAARHEYKLSLAMIEYFTFSAGGSYDFETPYDGYYAFKLWGGDGGDSMHQWDSGYEVFQLGGIGGSVSAVSYFPQGTKLIIVVGEGGSIGAGGSNGGAPAYSHTASYGNEYFGGGGGGATDVRLNAGTLHDRILVAGGGGGGSGGDSSQGDYAAPNAGGNGGIGPSKGTNGQGSGFGYGGEMWDGGQGSQYGALGLGGSSASSGGAGGGGYYGGGGAPGVYGGGGGGSSFIGEEFTAGVPSDLPEKSSFIGDSKDGFALVSYLGDGYAPAPPAVGEAKAEHKDIPVNENEYLFYISSGSSRSSNRFL